MWHRSVEVYGKDLKSEKLVEQWPVMGKKEQRIVVLHKVICIVKTEKESQILVIVRS